MPWKPVSTPPRDCLTAVGASSAETKGPALASVLVQCCAVPKVNLQRGILDMKNMSS
jgi:hypothetical protein